MSEAALDRINAQVKSESETQTYREKNEMVEIEPMETAIEIVEEELFDVEHSLDDTYDNICEETGVIVERLKKIIVEKSQMRALNLGK